MLLFDFVMTQHQVVNLQQPILLYNLLYIINKTYVNAFISFNLSKFGKTKVLSTSY